MKEKITHVRRDNQGRIIEVKTDKNNVYDTEVAKEFIINSQIENALVDINTLSGLAIINSIDKDNFLGFPEF
jgi:hypothetical protein